MLLALFTVERIETKFPAQFAELTVSVSAVVVATEATLHEERAERGGRVVVYGNPLGGRLSHAVCIDDVGVRLGRIVGIEFLFESRHKDGRLRI